MLTGSTIDACMSFSELLELMELDFESLRYIVGFLHFTKVPSLNIC